MYQTATKHKQNTRVDGMTRDEICEQYHRRIVFLARRLAARLPPSGDITAEDLVSFGAMGLLEAFDRYEEDRGVSFVSFADFRIRGAMMDALRAQDAFTRYRREATNRLDEARRELSQRHGREPQPEEVAEHLDMSMKEYWRAHDRSGPVYFESLDAGGGDDESVSLHEQITDIDSVDALGNLLDSELRHRLTEAIRELPEKKRHCVVLYYVKNMTLQEIAEVYGVTHSRISQILSAARKDLRDALEEGEALRACA